MKTSLLVFRLLDGFKNKKSLYVSVGEDSSLSYSLIGGWQSSGSGFAISNMGMSHSFPLSIKDFDDVHDLGIEISLCIRSGYYSISRWDALNEFPVPVPVPFPPLTAVFVVLLGDELVGFADSEAEAREFCLANRKIATYSWKKLYKITY